MAVSRPIVLALAGLVLVIGAFVATRGAGTEEAGSEPASAPAQKPGGASAQRPAADNERPPAARDTTPDGAAAGGAGAARGAALLNKPGPARLARAQARGALVVLFIREPGAADDRATARSVAALRASAPRGVTIASIPVGDISEYSAITGRAGVSQAPAIVISKGSRGRSKELLLEGYTDPASLRQHVADASR